MKALLTLVALTSLLAACKPESTIHSHKFLSFGTIVEIKIYSSDATKVRQAFDAVEQEFLYMETRRPDAGQQPAQNN